MRIRLRVVARDIIIPPIVQRRAPDAILNVVSDTGCPKGMIPHSSHATSSVFNFYCNSAADSVPSLAAADSSPSRLNSLISKQRAYFVTRRISEVGEVVTAACTRRIFTGSAAIR